MRIRQHPILHALFAFFIFFSLEAYAASPTLTLVLPRGGQRGTEVDVVLRGDRLGDAEEILFYNDGISVLNLEPAPKEVKGKLRIAPDCVLGEHALRLRTKTGISELRTFWIGALPTVGEVEPNSEFGTPQQIELGVTLAGVVQNEDVDFFAFAARKGQRVSAEIEGMRLGTTVFDPYLAILNSARFELATQDDSALLRQDAAVQALIPEDGTYFVEVRESAYGGSDSCHYRLHIGTFPRPLAVYPPGGRRGEEIEVRFLGDLGEPITSKITLPPEMGDELPLFAEDGGGVAPSANAFRLSDLANVLEQEPNNGHKDATAGPAPAAFNGVLSNPGDVDCFRFKASKGQVYDIQVLGRRLRSPLDPVLRLHQLGGKQVAANDDAGGPDSALRFKVPEDKEYVITVSDHLGKGGPTYVYRVEISPVSPALSSGLPKVTQFSQERQAIAVPRGNRYATMVSVTRRDFGGPITLEPEELPAGIAFVAETMPANLSSFPVLFEATPDAPLGAALTRLSSAHADKKSGIAGNFQQIVELSYGEPNNAVYWTSEVHRLAVAVTEAAPFSLRIVQPKVPLVRNGSMRLRVVADRAEGFDAPIGISMPFLPPGIGAGGGISIAKGATEAFLPLTANGGAEVRTWKVLVTAVADAGGGPVWVSSPFADLEIALPFLDLSLERAASEQGTETEVFCKVENARKYEGDAKISLIGLPHKVSAPDVRLKADADEFAFKVQIDKESPAGTHKNIFCRVEIEQEGEAIVHSTGSTELRIDKPLPPKADAPAAPPPPKKAEKPQAKPKPKPKPKRLTRLQKLRLEREARQRANDAEPESKESP